MVAQIQKESERQKSIREQEEKLMVSAWYVTWLETFLLETGLQ